MKPDCEIKRDVDAELSWSADVDQTDLAVKVTNGVVTLSGFVPSFFEKYRAEEAVKRVAGVAGIANAVQIRPVYGLDDPEIARAVIAAIQVELSSNPESVKALVRNGHVTLEGSVEWNFQRERLEDAVHRLRGVMTVDNEIMIKPRVKPGDVKHMIEDAFRRSAEVDASHISVAAEGGMVTLSGRVRTWFERAQAQQTAWFAPGVSDVKNEITIST